jgi:hypothetical protein
MLQYFSANNNNTGKRWVKNPFNENLTVASELETKIHD